MKKNAQTVQNKSISDQVAEWLTDKGVCDNYPGFSERKLARGRTDGTGPDFCKVGRKVLYRRSAIEKWLASREFTSTAEAKKAGVF